jgi:2-aminoadipate transaminase
LWNFAYADRVFALDEARWSSAPGDVEILFLAGDAYPAALPDMTQAAHVALTTFRAETLQYAPDRGLPELREWIASYVGEEGVRITANHVLIVNGAKHGLDLVCRLFLNPGDALAVTSPTYMSALRIFQGFEIDLIDIAQDSDGLIVEDLAERLRARKRIGARAPKMVYNVPEFHNPTGLTMSERRRMELVALAEREGLLVVEDDPYRRIRFEGVPVPPIQSFDESGRVIGLGTFAKIIAPGLRVGWVSAEPEIITKMVGFKSDGGSCPLTQRMILEYCKAGRVDSHVNELVKSYSLHRDVMFDMVTTQLPGATTRKPEGGYYLWVQLPDGMDSERLLSLALAEGVGFLPASWFYPNAGPPNYVRLAYSYCSPEAIAEGMRRLGRVFRRVAG